MQRQRQEHRLARRHAPWSGTWTVSDNGHPRRTEGVISSTRGPAGRDKRRPRGMTVIIPSVMRSSQNAGDAASDRSAVTRANPCLHVTFDPTVSDPAP